jgi:hypothetical protein
MYRIACALVALTVSAARAFRAGNANAFKGKQISGVGTSFHGPMAERLADGSTRTSLVITLGATDPAGQAGKILLIDTWDQFVAAERTRTTLLVALSGPNLPLPPTSAPAAYEFSGVYDGQMRTVPRVPGAGQIPGTDQPCPGEQPRDASSGDAFSCAPLLTGATATLHR